MSLTTNCSEAGRGTTDYPVPASLGNGLVYDALYLLIGRPRLDPADPIMPPVEEWVAQRREKGFRPVQLDVKPFYDAGQAILRWDLPEYVVTLVSDEDANHPIEVRVDRTWAEFGDDDAELSAEGFRPLVVSPAMINSEPSFPASQRYSLIYVQDGYDGDPWIAANMTETELVDFVSSQSQHRPISLEASTRWDSLASEYKRQFTVVLEVDEISMNGDWDYTLELENSSALMDDIADKSNEGLVPFYVSTGAAITSSGAIELTETRFNVLYVKRPPAVGQVDTLDVEVEPDMQDGDLGAKHNEMLAQGYHLVSVASYRNPSDMKKLYVGIWHRYGEWIETVEGDATTVGQDYEPLEDAIRALMETENIPAAQLAVIQGEDLVLSRAYTRAPVAYAPITTATPLMAGSITKPVTAVAALQVIGLQQGQGQGQPGIEGDLMDLVPAPTVPGGTKPSGVTVRQALQHTSGWVIGGSTLALSVKNMIGEGRMPTSMDWLNWTVHQARQPRDVRHEACEILGRAHERAGPDVGVDGVASAVGPAADVLGYRRVIVEGRLLEGRLNVELDAIAQ